MGEGVSMVDGGRGVVRMEMWKYPDLSVIAFGRVDSRMPETDGGVAVGGRGGFCDWGVHTEAG